MLIVWNRIQVNEVFWSDSNAGRSEARERRFRFASISPSADPMIPAFTSTCQCGKAVTLSRTGEAPTPSNVRIAAGCLNGQLRVGLNSSWERWSTTRAA